MRLLSLLLILGLSAGCTTTTPAKDFYRESTDVFSEGRSLLTKDSIRDIHIENFFKTHPRWTEHDKINYLLESIRLSEITFVRNGRSYNAIQASKWLRWKMAHRQFRANPITTAADFVARVCDRSKKTGMPYEVVLRDGTRAPAQQIINGELKSLEKAISIRSV